MIICLHMSLECVLNFILLYVMMKIYKNSDKIMKLYHEAETPKIQKLPAFHDIDFCLFPHFLPTHSSILAWRIQWTEKPGRLPSMGSQRVRQGWATKHTHEINYSRSRNTLLWKWSRGRVQKEEVNLEPGWVSVNEVKRGRNNPDRGVDMCKGPEAGGAMAL